jgi:hypothetical protein
MSLPPGWDDRHNTMSEKDMQPGGAAATRFASSGVYGENAAYQTSDQVRAHYHNNVQESADSTLLPMGCETDAKQHGVFTRNQEATMATKEPATDQTPEVALVQVATFSLEALAKTLEANSDVNVPLEERTAFANAMRRAMNALAKSSS